MTKAATSTSRGRKIWTLFIQTCRDALAAIDAALDRATGRPAKLDELKTLVRTEGAQPFARARAITEVQRFLADPLSWKPPSVRATSAEADLAGAFIPHALQAQTHAFAGRHREAATAMAEARACLAPPAPGPARNRASERRHRETLRALAGSFQRAHLQDDSSPPNDAALAASGEVPAISYLFEQDAECASKRNDYAAAVDAITRAIAVADAPSLEHLADYACRAAWYATSAYDAGKPEAQHLLDIVERSLLKPLAEPKPPLPDAEAPRTLDRRWAGEVAFWRGLIALQQAKSHPDDDVAVEAATRRSRRSFHRVKRPESNPATVEAAESWLPDAKKLRATAVLRRDGRLSPAVAALQTAAPVLAKHIRAHKRCRWDSVDAALRCSEPEGQALAAELGTEMARFLASQRNLTLPAAAPRLILEISQGLLADDTEAKRLREADDRPGIPSLRALIKTRYGVTLPGVLVRIVEDEGWLLPLLDGTPLTAPKNLQPGQRFADPGQQATTADWLSLELEPTADGEFDVVEYAAWSLGQAVLGALPDIAGLPDLPGMGLADLPPARILPFIRILLADRTMLTERDALRARAIDVAQGRLSPLAAAEAFRRLPAIRGDLWGVSGPWSSLLLTPELETELALHVGLADLAITLPRDLSARIDKHIEQQSSTQKLPRIVVRDPAIRPFLRAHTSRSGRDFPVVTEAEIEAAA